jgi:hypothetical protein
LLMYSSAFFFGVAGKEDTGRAVSQEDADGIVVRLGEEPAFGIGWRRYNVCVWSKPSRF